MKKHYFVLMILLLFGIFVGGVEAKSEYYNYIWTNDVDYSYDYIGFVTNDIIKVDDGFLSVGFKDNYAYIRLLNEDGTLKKDVKLEGETRAKLKRIFALDDGYIAFGFDGGRLKAIVLDKNYKYIDTYELEGFGWEWDEYEIYVVKDSGKFYLFNDYYYNQDIVEFSVEDEEFNKVNYDDLATSTKKVLGNYFRMMEYDECRNVPGSVTIEERSTLYKKGALIEKRYCSTFIKPYNDGYVFGLFDYNSFTSKVVYYTDKEEWIKEYNNQFIKDGIQVKDYFLYLVAPDNVDSDTLFILVDEKAKEVEEDKVKGYFIDEEYQVFFSEHLISLGSGFALTGSEYVCETVKESKVKSISGTKSAVGYGYGDNSKCYADKILYFSTGFAIYTKTDDNGTIEANMVRAKSGELVEFTIKPNEGYVLSAIKVTDAVGNVITFTDYKFTMPSADVTIEATFVKAAINPNTLAGTAIAIVTVALICAAFMIVRNYRKISWLK